MAEQLILLEALKESIHERVNALYTQIVGLVPGARSASQFITDSYTIDDVRQKYINTIESIVMLNIKHVSGYKPSFKELNSFENMISAIKCKRDELLSEKDKITSSAVPTKSDTLSKNHIKLPVLDIPSFDGNLQNWSIFYESFKTNIHSNKSLDDSQRIQYLIGKLTHSALNIVAGIIPTGENYSNIWDSLVKKYQDNRTLGSFYINNIFNMSPTNNNAISLNDYIDNLTARVAAFKQLGIKDNTDFILLCSAIRKLDSQTVNEFEMSVRGKDIPLLNDLIEFIRQKVKILERTSTNNYFNSNTGISKTKNNTRNVSKSFVTTRNTKPTNCPLCKITHTHFYQCSEFRKLKPKEKYNLLKSNNGCINCLSLAHKIASCNSTHSCKHCNKKHHTMLHFENENVSSNNNSESMTIASTSTSLYASNNDKLHTKVILSTAQVYAYLNENNKKLIRCLIDNCSQNNLITLACCKKLNLRITPLHNSIIKGVGVSSKPIYGYTSFKIQSRINQHSYEIQCLILDQITEDMPSECIDHGNFPKLISVPLADSTWHIPGAIDVILGAQMFPHILLGGRINVNNLSPLIETTLGYLIMGNLPHTFQNNKVNSGVSHTMAMISSIDQSDLETSSFCTYSELEDSLHKFWQLEEIPSAQHLSPEDMECEQQYCSTATRDCQGRFIVTLPFSREPSLLGNSYATAQRRLMSLEHKFRKDPALRNQYNDVINDYIKNDYLIESPSQHEEGYFIPHRAVIRQDKLTSKLRIVLDASAKTHTGVSLNDIMHTGHNLQSDLFSLLLNFRLFAVAITADIKQMYLRIGVKEEHQKYLKILYRFNDDESVRIFQFKCVPFGLRASPYLAMRTIRKLAEDEEQSFPNAARVAKSDFYMDDLVKSVHASPGDQEAVRLVTELISFFASGKFHLVKFASNSKDLLAKLPPQNLATVEFADNMNYKILGLEWFPESDIFSFKIVPCTDKCTKRIMLSVIAGLFDVLGLVSPVILTAKLLIKSLWSANIGWDDLPPDNIICAYRSLIDELPLLSNLKIPRYLNVAPGCKVNIVAFCDASLKGYGCAVYLHVIDANGNISTNLVCSKSKVAPVKVVSLARLELCSALLLSKLVRIVYDSFNPRYPIQEIYAFSDSTIALSWIHSSPHRWSIFVANRVAKIHENLDCKHFYHISGIENPSDCLSRGLMPSQILRHELWWNAPNWVSTEPDSWPIKPFISTALTDIPEFNSKTLTVLVTEPPILYPLILRISSWNRLLRAVIYVLRFTRKLTSVKNIQVDHLNLAERYVLLTIQQVHFDKEYTTISQGKELPLPFKRLDLFIDKEGIIRIGGRLSNADLPYESKHPALLPKSDPGVDLLVEHFHKKNCHAGANLLGSIMKQRYWIVSSRNVIRKKVRQCNSCFRVRPNGPHPKMANLPEYRVNETTKAFVHTGVDYAGPIRITLARRRGQRYQKAYICIFSCLTTRAVHVELVPDLSSDGFINAFKRFLSRRGPVSCLYSDNGTNFIGAKAQLKELYTLIASSEFYKTFAEELLLNKIQWKMIPPHTPHFGGCWESQVKSFKSHLYRVIGSQVLTYEELSTVLIQVEAVLNCRPLCLLSEEPNPEILTPAHFLMTTPLQFLPSEDVLSERPNLLSRKRLLDSLVQSFWKKWRLEYLHTLQTRQKWCTEDNPIEVGTIVLLYLDDVPPLRWPLGKIEKVFPGSDGIVRVALVRTKNGLLKRPVIKLCPLPTQ